MCTATRKVVSVGNRFSVYFLRVIFLIFFTTSCSGNFADAVLSECSSASNVQITSPCKFSPGNHSFVFLTINSDVYLEMTHQSCDHAFQVAQDLVIERSANVHVGYCEKLVGNGNGVKTDARSFGSGASHGGRGGTASFQVLTAAQAPAYGNVFDVTTHGSRGGGSSGGKGGGYVRLVANKLILKGVIRAVGENAMNNDGGGSGGGVAITTDQIDGTGRIEVFGGLGAGKGGGGAGGRTSVTSKQGVFQGQAHAFGGKSSK